MKQVLHDFRSGDVVVAEVPVPAVDPKGVLVRNCFSAVSPGTERATMQTRSRNVVRTAFRRRDLVQRVLTKVRRDGIMATFNAVRRRLDVSTPLGYSSAGEVVEVGSQVTDIAVGQSVACAGAGYANHAEYVCVPRLLCRPVPEGVSLDAASFATLGAIAMQGVRQAEVSLGETVAVIGLGIIGQLIVQILSAGGCRVVGMDLNAARVERAFQNGHGTGLAIDPQTERAVMDLTDGHGVDRVIITAATRSNEPIELSAAISRDRGRVVVVGDVGMDLPRPPFYEKELELRLSKSYGPGRYDPTYEAGGLDYPYAYVRWTENRNMQAFLELVEADKVRPLELVTHRATIDQADALYGQITGADSDALGVLIEYPAPPKAEMPTRVTVEPRPRREGEIGLAVLGAGNFARSVIIPTLAKVPSARLVAIGSARGVTARDLARKYKCQFCTTRLEDILTHDEVDGVVIATPHNLHAEQAIQALAANKSVYLEKPLALKEDDLDRIRQAAQQSEGCLFVGYNRRFSPMGIRMQETFAERQAPVAIHCRVNADALSSDHWVNDPEVGGGWIVGEACHFVDFVKSIVGRPVSRVTARSAGQNPNDVLAMLEFDDGSIGTIAYLTSGPPTLSKEHVEVIGCGKACGIEDFRCFTRHDGRRGKTEKQTQDKGHQAALTGFVEAVAGRRPSAFDVDDLLDTSRITFQMRDAAGATSRR